MHRTHLQIGATLLALVLTSGCAEQQIWGSVDDYHEMYGSPRNTGSATLIGWPRFDDDQGNGQFHPKLCNEANCEGHAVPFSLSGVDDGCREAIEGRRVTVTGRMRDRVLADVVIIRDVELDQPLCFVKPGVERNFPL